LFNPEPNIQVSEYKRRIDISNEDTIFSTIFAGDLNPFDVTCGTLKSLASNGDIMPSLMDVLLCILIDRDQFYREQYYRQRRDDRDRKGNSTYRPLKEIIFLLDHMSIDKNLPASVDLSYNEFFNSIRLVIKPIRYGYCWQMHIIDIEAMKWNFFDPSGDYANRDSCR
jgi:hypothetical protein